VISLNLVNFNKAIQDGSFTVDDIGIINGTINSGSFTKVSATQYTIMVTPSLGGKHSNVIVMVGTNAIVLVVVMIRFPLLFCRCLVPDNNTSNFVFFCLFVACAKHHSWN
jgi:hypothetical protein